MTTTSFNLAGLRRLSFSKKYENGKILQDGNGGSFVVEDRKRKLIGGQPPSDAKVTLPRSSFVEWDKREGEKIWADVPAHIRGFDAA